MGQVYAWASPSALAELSEPQLAAYETHAIQIERERVEHQASALAREIVRIMGPVLGLKLKE